MKRRMVMTLLVPITLLASGCGYNRIQQLDEAVSAANGNVAAQLKRRVDLVPNLVNTVKGYATLEEAVFTEVANARSRLAGAVETRNPEQMEAANAGMTSALGRLLAISEAYPQLKADQSFLKLQDELAGTENRIAVARTDYNTVVGQYNTYIRQFPQKLTAMVTGAKEREYFEAPESANDAPVVDFGTPAAPPAQ